MKRIGIFIFYNKYGRVYQYIKYLLSDIKKNLTTLVIVCNGQLNKEGSKYFEDVGDYIYLRDNVGFDAGAYKEIILELIQRKAINLYDELVLFNNSFYGPVGTTFYNIFQSMENKSYDFWGIAAGGDKDKVPDHIQSYFIVVRASMLHSKSFREYWESQKKVDTLADAVKHFELRFTSYFHDKGYSYGTLIELKKLRQVYGPAKNYLNRFNYELLVDWNCPIIKRKYIMSGETGALYQNKEDIIDYLNQYTDYNTDLIWEDVINEYTPYDVCRCRHLYTFIFSDKVEYTKNTALKKELAAVIIVACAEYCNEVLDYLNERLEGEEHVLVVLKEEKETSILQTIERVQQTVGTETLLCLITDCGIPQNMPWKKRWMFDRLGALVDSASYVENIVSAFQKQKKMGLLMPEVYYDLKTYQNIGMCNKMSNENAEALRDIGYSFCMDENENMLAACGGFWCRMQIFNSLNQKRVITDDKVLEIAAYLARMEGFYTSICNNLKNFKRDYAIKSSVLNCYFENVNKNEALINIEKSFDVIGKDSVIKFCRKFDGVYIYGMGVYGKSYFSFLKSNNITIRGFVVSDNEKVVKKERYHSYYIGQLNLKKNEGIIVAVHKNKQPEIMKFLTKYPESSIYFS